MISQVFEAQRKNPTTKDWVTMVKYDLELLNMKLEEIPKMNKKEFMKKIKEKIILKTKMDLNEMKESHSKVRQIEYPILKMQKYLKPNEEMVKVEEKKLLFRLRCETTNLKMNMKSLYEE